LHFFLYFVEENQENRKTVMDTPLDLDTLPNASKLSLDEQILAAEKEFLAKQPKVGMAQTPADAVSAQKLNENLAAAAAEPSKPTGIKVAEAPAPEPAVAESPAPEPAVAESPAAEPAVAESLAAEPAVAESPAAEPAVAESPAPAEVVLPDSPLEVIHHKRNLSLDEKIELFEKEIQEKATSKPPSPEKAAVAVTESAEEETQGKQVLSLDERLAAAEKELGAAAAPPKEVAEDTRPIAERVADKVGRTALPQLNTFFFVLFEF